MFISLSSSLNLVALSIIVIVFWQNNDAPGGQFIGDGAIYANLFRFNCMGKVLSLLSAQTFN